MENAPKSLLDKNELGLCPMSTKLDEKNIEDLHCKYSGSDTAYSLQPTATKTHLMTVRSSLSKRKLV
ncbi:hypothetical protein CGJ31_23915 [Vibrio parahaemolyticus]|nr:hypothetical protein CGJ31_23915 [Vibrio parahaemolyticus]